MCERCNNFKPERANHCKTCDKCILDYDHHCPWIMNCVGGKNHKAFTLFLLYMTVGAIDFIKMSLNYYYHIYDIDKV